MPPAVAPSIAISRHVRRQATEYAVSAQCQLPSTPPDLVVRAHVDEAFAHAFRDIKKYTAFSRGDDGAIHTQYDARVGFLRFPMEVVKSVHRAADDGDVIRFSTARGCLATFEGEWRVRGDGNGGSVVELQQTVSAPAWARVLPVEASIRSRVANAMSDMASLASAPPPR